MSRWDYTKDIVVVGSGAGGMTAALVAGDRQNQAIVLEKSPVYGGSTALSGGGIWVPCNHLMAEAGIDDSGEEAMAYLQAVTQSQVAAQRLQAYVQQAATLVKYLAKNSHVQFEILPGLSDYYAEHYGGKQEGGRTLIAKPFDRRQLGILAKNLRQPHPQTLIWGRITVTPQEASQMVNSSFPGRLNAAYILSQYFLNPRRLLGRYDSRLTMGNALIGRLRLSLADRNIPVWLNTSVQQLMIENNQVVGVKGEQNGKSLMIRAKKGVILASGGFARNKFMRSQYQRHPISDRWTAANPDNMGDGIRMGMSVGAECELMESAWWTPTSVVPGSQYAYVLIIEKSLPGSMMVNSQGKRFTNEADPYIDVVKDMYKTDSVPAFFVFDRRFRYQYPTGPLMPGLTPKKYIDNGYIQVANTIEDLGKKCGIEPQGLIETTRKMNQYAVTGLDLDFHRGDNSYNRYYGDTRVKPNPCLGAIDCPPFYAVKVFPGDLGTKGGLKTDENARVLRKDGSAIAGLYAIGNVSASVMGDTYPGGGATIGPAMTFGYIAACHATSDG
ncbi:MAG: FAD-dependent oxidoreductase [Coleofasciculus sp. G1-WW12-02]|uniref:FAD-dependent oxidoreductase n=1 Tax=Coleofasciculus sp. G1-WW12-02 TaxID=3068483 RepID=UPI0032FB8E8C